MRTRTNMPDKLYIVTDSTGRSLPSDGVPIKRAHEIAKLMDHMSGSGRITIRGPYVLQSRQAVEINGEPVAPFPQEGVFTFGKGELLIHPGSQLIFSALASGITGTIQIYGAADMFESWYLPYYIG